MNDMPDTPNLPDGPPPILGSWRNVYVFVLVYEVCVIVLFYLFTKAMA